MDFMLEEAVDMLARTPPTLNALLRDLPDHWIRENEGPDTWSPFDVVGHLIHGEETDWITRARIILTHQESRPFDPFDRFAQFKKEKGKPLGELLDRFARLRERNITVLRGMKLQPADLELKGRHPELGTVTLGELLATWVAHDLDHLAQVSRVMAKQYSGAAGPWGAYLRIMGE